MPLHDITGNEIKDSGLLTWYMNLHMPYAIKERQKPKKPVAVKNTTLLVNTQGLMQMLSCGRPGAIKTGEEAHAKVRIGRKILWNVECVRKYINSIAE